MFFSTLSAAKRVGGNDGLFSLHVMYLGFVKRDEKCGFVTIEFPGHVIVFM